MVAQGHMCEFGMTNYVEKLGGEQGPVKKPMGFMTSSWCICDELSKRCDPSQGHQHMPLVAGSAAAAAQVYPENLRRAICRGIAKQKAYDHGLNCIQSRVVGKRQLSSIIESAGCAKPVGDWLAHYVDPMHELDGGDERTHTQDNPGWCIRTT